jgi:hypothetical protein
MAFTGWSGLYNREYTDLANGFGSLTTGKYDQRNRIKMVVNRNGFRAFTALFNGLIGAASGSNVTATHKRVEAVTKTSGPQGGGARNVETLTDINRNTTAADITALKEMVYNVTHKPSSYPAGNPLINPR